MNNSLSVFRVPQPNDTEYTELDWPTHDSGECSNIQTCMYVCLHVS